MYDFNSIKVRLERNTAPEDKGVKVNFNSIKVRLEHDKFANSDFDNKFQFHKGAIRTR